MPLERKPTGYAEPLLRILLGYGLAVLGVLFFLMAWGASLEHGATASTDGGGIAGYRKDIVVLVLMGLLFCVLGPLLVVKAKRGSK